MGFKISQRTLWLLFNLLCKFWIPANDQPTTTKQIIIILFSFAMPIHFAYILRLFVVWGFEIGYDWCCFSNRVSTRPNYKYERRKKHTFEIIMLVSISSMVLIFIRPFILLFVCLLIRSAVRSSVSVRSLPTHSPHVHMHADADTHANAHISVHTFEQVVLNNDEQQVKKYLTTTISKGTERKRKKRGIIKYTHIHTNIQLIC